MQGNKTSAYNRFEIGGRAVVGLWQAVLLGILNSLRGKEKCYIQLFSKRKPDVACRRNPRLALAGSPGDWSIAGIPKGTYEVGVLQISSSQIIECPTSWKVCVPS